MTLVSAYMCCVHLAHQSFYNFCMNAGDKVSVSADAEKKGVHFDLQEIFERKLKQPSCTQVFDRILLYNAQKH